MTKFIQGVSIEYLKAKLAPKRILADFQLNNKSYSIIMLGLVIACGILYLTQINSMATKGYRINDLETQIQRLESANQNLQYQVTEARSMTNLEARLAQSQMVPVGHIDYIKANTGVVAVNR